MQRQLFEDAAGPPGFEYWADFITVTEELDLLDDLARLPFAQVEMRGVVARRQTAHFGWTYGYYSRRASAGPPLPEFLAVYRDRAAHWAGIAPERFVEALVTRYPEGAPIGWHRDAPMFGDVIAGISLGASCRMKFRPCVSPAEAVGARRTTHEIELAPRSGYLIAGVARREFEHSIPAVAALRYSITFRTLRDQRRVRHSGSHATA
jgi:DNA oxidative demethylase